jgi:hypothetical protein
MPFYGLWFFNLEQRFSTSWYLRTPNSKAVPKLYSLKHWNLAIMILQSINVIFSFKFNYLSTLVDVSFNWESCSFDSFSHKVYFLNCHKNVFLRTLCKLLGYVVESRWPIGYLELLLSQKLVILNPAIFIFLFKKLPLDIDGDLLWKPLCLPTLFYTRCKKYVTSFVFKRQHLVFSLS